MPKARYIAGPATEIQQSARGPVNLHVVESAAAAGTALLQIAVDYSKADVPQRAYYADFSRVVLNRVGGLSLFFGKLIPGTSQLRTKVEIVFHREMFARQLWTSSRDFHAKLKTELAGKALEPLNDWKDTEMVQSFNANNVFMAKLGEDALMDFYYIPPSDIHFFRRHKRAEINLDPVIRIVLNSTVLLEFLDQCSSQAEAMIDLQSILETGKIVPLEEQES